MVFRLGLLDKFFGILDLPQQTKSLVVKYLILFNVFSFIALLGQSYIILNYIDNWGFYYAGILSSVSLLVQLMTDYPTGSLSDYIGQRNVIALACVFMSIPYFLISQYTSLWAYFFASVSFGLGVGQISGAFESYLDNNYKKSVGQQDSDWKIYGYAYQRMMTLANMVNAVSVIGGGFLSVLLSRNTLFLMISIMFLLYIPIVINFLKDYKDTTNPVKVQEKKNIFFYLRGGIKYFLSTKESFLLIMARVSIMVIEGLWVELMLIPFYFAYTGTDAGVGLFRGVVLLATFLLRIYTTKYTKKIGEQRLGLLNLLYYVVFFPSLIILFIVVPAQNSFNLLGGLLGLSIVVIAIGIISLLVKTLFQRIMLNKIPSDIRNSVYSLIPSIANIIQIFLLPILGFFILKGGDYGLLVGALFLLVISLLSLVFLFLYLRIEKNESFHTAGS